MIYNKIQFRLNQFNVTSLCRKGAGGSYIYMYIYLYIDISNLYIVKVCFLVKCFFQHLDGVV